MAESRRVADTVAEEAFTLAEALGDSARAARAAVQAIDASNRSEIRWYQNHSVTAAALPPQCRRS